MGTSPSHPRAAPLRGLTVALVLAASPSVACAAALSGKVTTAGKPLAGAWVQLNTGVVAATDVRGRYSFSPLPRATYALQVFAAGKQPVMKAGLVPGGTVADIDLTPTAAPLGLVHVKAVRPDRAEACPVRVVTRWRPAPEAQFDTPEPLALASTLDANGQPLIPHESVRPWIVPFGACLWTLGEAVLALRPGQAELTCTSGPLFAALQQVVDVKPGEVTEVAANMTVGMDLGALGWAGGDVCRVSGGEQATYVTNIPLAAAVCRAEGMNWVCLAPGFGNDPAQGGVPQVLRETSSAALPLGQATEVPGTLGGRVVVLEEPGLEPPEAPYSAWAPALKRGVAFYDQPLTGNPARGLPFDVVADPGAVHLLGVSLRPPDGADYARLWALLATRHSPVGPVALSGACLDTGAVPVGPRTFVRVQGNRDMDGVVGGLREGSTLVTTGPVVNFSIAESLPGQALRADDKTRVAEIDTWFGSAPGGGIALVELVRGGEVVKSWRPQAVGPGHVQARVVIRERDDTWFAVRAYGPEVAGAGTPMAWTAPVGFTSTPAGPPVADVAGKVYDQATGAPVAGAKVTATPPVGKVVSTTSAADGTYRFQAHPASRFEASAPQYTAAPAPSPTGTGTRADSAPRYLAWDCPQVLDLLRSSSRDSLLDPLLYRRLRDSADSARLDFPLTRR
jgi:Carboxypeptidase regulatory-like domain